MKRFLGVLIASMFLASAAIAADDIGIDLIDQRTPLSGPPVAPKEEAADPGARE